MKEVDAQQFGQQFRQRFRQQFTEYHTVKQIDNSRLVRPANPARAQDFWKRLAVGAAMAAGLLFYAWQHFECIQIRYQIEQLDSAARQGQRAESAIASGSGHAAFADARGRDCAEPTWPDGPGSRAGGARAMIERRRGGAGARGRRCRPVPDFLLNEFGVNCGSLRSGLFRRIGRDRRRKTFPIG